MQSLLWNNSGSKTTRAWGRRFFSGADEDDIDDDVPLVGAVITSYRGVIARCNYLGSDRPECISICQHCTKTWSKTQAVIAKSSVESEVYGFVRGACEGLGIKTLCMDMGSDVGIRLEVVATAAKGSLDW